MTTSPLEGGPSLSARLLTVPNVLSFLRLASVPVFLWLFISGDESAAVALYGVGALSDFFDGFIARRWHQESELGRVLDPLADRVSIVALTVALVVRDAFPWWLAVGIVLRDFILVSLWPLFERRRVGRIAVNLTGKTATALLLIGLAWLGVGETDLAGAGYPGGIGLALATAGAVLYWVAGLMYAAEAVGKLRSAQSAETSER